MDKTGVKLLIFCVEVINSKLRQLRGNLVMWYKSMFAVWRKRES